MSLTFPMGFTLSVQEPIDNRLLLTTAQMKAAVKASFPKYYLTICSDGEGAGKIFIFDSTIPKTDKDPVYGYFRPFASSDISLVTSWDTVSDDTAPSSKLVKGSLDGKVDKVTGKQLSTEDYTTAEKTKLAGIEDNAQRNVQSDWNATEGDALILNKPDLSKFITRTVNDLENYYLKSEVDAKLSDVLRLAIVTALPAVGVENVLYLKSTSGPAGKEYDEYIWVNNSWELIGSTDFTLTITQNADGISINGTALQDATVSRDGLMTKEAFAKLDGIEAGAQANVIEGITVDSVPVPIDQKVVNIDLSGKVDKVEGKGLSTNDFTDADKDKLDALDENAIEDVKVNGASLPVVDKSVNVDLTEYTTKAMAIARWDPILRYSLDSVVILDSILYASLTDDNIGNDPTEEGSQYWKECTGEGSGPSSVTGVTVVFGNDMQTEYYVSHKFNSYDFLFTIRTNDSLRRYVHADVYAVDKNRAKIVLADPPGVNGLVINMVNCVSGEQPEEDVKVITIQDPSDSWNVDNPYEYPVFIQTYTWDEDGQYYDEMDADVIQLPLTGFTPVTIDFDTPKSGFVVMAPSESQHTFEDSDTWVINHGTNELYAVQVYDAEEGMMLPDISQANGTITISFEQPRSGWVVLTKPSMTVHFDNRESGRVTHNLGRYVGMQVYADGAAGQAFLDCHNIDENTCEADFNGSFSGYLLII